MENRNKIQSFTQLRVWKTAHNLVIDIYRTTKGFPLEERYGLVNQMRRAAVSITSNIAEGFSRQGKKEKIQFYYIAQGSNIEIQNQLLIVRDIGYIKKDKFGQLADRSISVAKQLNALISSVKKNSKDNL